MVNANKGAEPTRYIIQVRGYLDAHWEHWFEGLNITLADNGVTILSGDVIDQSQLHGILEKIHSLNLSLISVQKIDPDIEKNNVLS